jgi:hypothetical protein
MKYKYAIGCLFLALIQLPGVLKYQPLSLFACGWCLALTLACAVNAFFGVKYE